MFLEFSVCVFAIRMFFSRFWAATAALMGRSLSWQPAIVNGE